MSKLKVVAVVLKFINGHNAGPDSLRAICNYNELVEQTTAYAQEHQREAANLALAMQQ